MARSILAVLVSLTLALTLVPIACSQPVSVQTHQDAAAPAAGADLRTVAEKSDFKATARYDDVVALLDALAKSSPLARRFDMGVSGQGRAIPVLAISDPPVATAEEAAKQKDKLTVLLLGGIHAGEVDGKEALPMLARELLAPAGDDGKVKRPLLKDLIILIAPIYNPDGNENTGSLAQRRPGQVGPDQGGVGARENAAGLDLNRDFVKLEAPETRALVKLLNDWDPAVVIDTHTTDGSFHQYLISYAGPKVPAGNANLITYVRDTMMPAVSASLLDTDHVKSFWYGNFDKDHTRWETYPAEARYGTSYIGLRNRIGILSEGYSYASYKDRVLGTRDFVRECLSYAAASKPAIKKLLADADAAAIDAGKKHKDTDRIALRTKAMPRGGKVTVLGYEDAGRPLPEHAPQAAGTARAMPDTPKEYQVELWDSFEPTKSVSRPFVYLLPPSLAAAVENLQRHGIEVEELREDIELDAEVYHAAAVTRASRPFQGHSTITVDTTATIEARRFPAGTIVVRTAQKLGSLACYLLEPECEDGLTTWNFFDASLGEGTPEFPAVRLLSPQPMTTGKIHPFRDASAAGAKRPITFETMYESDKAPNFNGSPVSIGQWLDDNEHFLQVKDNRLWVIEARTGRAAPFHDPAVMAAALAKLPTIGEKAAKSIAERSGFTTTKDRTAALIEQDNDLYWCRFDGEGGAVRLTSTPQREESPSISPDGKFVAFIRDNDLYVVDVATQHERALTTGGTDQLRNGKNDWVYFEEIFNRNWRAFWWSPDSSHIAFLQIDSSPERIYTIASDLPEPQGVERTPYPKPGQGNPKARVGIVPVAGGDVRWMDAAAGGYDETGHLISGIGWLPDSSAAWCFIQNRVQSWLDFCTVPTSGGTPTRVLRETTKAWVDQPPDPKFLNDGSFLWLSERSGYKHIYRFTRDGKPFGGDDLKPLDDGPWEVHSIVHVDGESEDSGPGTATHPRRSRRRDTTPPDAPRPDHSSAPPPSDSPRWIYFTGTKDGSTTENLYREHLDGSGLERLTDEPGMHAVSMSPDARYFVDSWSTIASPTRVVLCETNPVAGKAWTRTLDTNPVHALDDFRFGRVERLEIPVGSGDQAHSLEALIVYPPDFDPAKKYPIWFMTYGGPHTPTVFDSWSGGRVWDQVLASAGIVAVHADPWTASGKGAASAWPCYKQLGVLELQDLTAAMKWLTTQHPWADPARIGMAGHSYGGFMTSYALTHCDTFAAGIAGAPVTDWRDYDSIYTERFMLTPQDNPDGYDATSVVKAAAKLHGKLLLIHGGLDDNVHLQNSERLIKALQDANKPFEFMLYPTSRHGVGGKHYQRLQYDFIRRAIGAPQQPDTIAPTGNPNTTDQALGR